MSISSNPYIGPRTFKEDERDRFFGRDREANELLARVLSEQETVFYAQSGAGKSSLVNTCLIPELKRRGIEALQARVGGEARVGLDVDNIFVFNLLRSLSTGEGEESVLAKQSLHRFLVPEGDIQYEPEEISTKQRVLIIDQFEEIFSTHHEAWDQRAPFFEQLAQALADDPRLRVLLVMREDFVANLDPYAYLLRSRFRIRYYMQRLEYAAALKAVKEPVKGKEFGRPYEKDVAEKLVDDLRTIKITRPDGTSDLGLGQFVEPLYLQVICFELWNNLPTDGTTITMKNVQDVGDVSTSLGNYFARRVAAVAAAENVSEGKIRKWFTEELISSAGVRNMVLEEPGETSAGLENRVIRALSDLIRAEQRGGSVFYELTHDRLVEPIRFSNTKWMNENSSALQKQAALWDSEGRKDSWLLTDDALADVEKWAREHPEEVGDNELEFLAACRNLQRQFVAEREAQLRIRRALQTSRIIAGIASLLLIVAIFLGVQSYQSQRSTQMQVMLNASAVEESRNNKELAARLAYQALVNYGDHGEVDEGLANIVVDSIAPPKLSQAPFLITGSIGVSEIAYRPSDGNQTLAAGFTDGNIVLVDVATQQAIGEPLAGHSVAVTGLAFSPDGLILASSSQDGSIILWDLTSHASKARLAGHIFYVRSIAFSPDGRLLASGGDDNSIILWDMQSLEPVGELLASNASPVTSVAFSPDGRVLASAYIDQSVLLWDIADVDDPRPIGESLRGHTDWVNTLAFSPDGNLLASGGDTSDKSIILWDVTDVHNVKQIGEPLTGHTDRVARLVFSPDGKTIASVGGYDGSLILWDVATGELMGQPVVQTDYQPLMNVAFSPDGSMLATGLVNIGEIRLWAANTLQPAASITDFLQDTVTAVNSMSITPDGKILAVTMDGFLLWDEQTGVQAIGEDNSRLFNPEYQLESSANPEIFALSPEGSLRVDGGSNRASLSDVTTGNILAGLRHGGQAFFITAVAFSPEGNLIASGDDHSIVRVWDVKTRRQVALIRRARKEAYPVVALSFSNDDSRIAIAYADAESTVEVWDIESVEKVFVVSNRQRKNLGYAVVGPIDSKPANAIEAVVGSGDRKPGEGTIETQANTGGQSEQSGNQIADIHYSQDGLFILYINGDLDQWDIWPSRTELRIAAEAICASCTLSTVQLEEYDLYSWPMIVHDNAGYIITFLYALFYGVCLWQVRQTVFQAAADQVAPHGFSWRKFLLASAQGFGLILISILTWYLVTNIEDIYYFQEETRYPTTDSFIWFALPLGLWTGGAYSHFTRLQSGKWSRILLGTLSGAVAGAAAGVLVGVLIPFSTTRNFAETVSDPSAILGITLLVGVLSTVMSLFGSLLYIFWLSPWSDGKLSTQVVGLHLLFGVGLFFTNPQTKRKWIYPLAVAAMIGFFPLVMLDLDYSTLGWDIIPDETAFILGITGFIIYLLSFLDLRRSLKAKDGPADGWDRIVELHLLFGIGLFFTNPQAKRKWLYPIAVVAMIGYFVLASLDLDYTNLGWDIIPDETAVVLGVIGFVIYLLSLVDLRRSLKMKDQLPVAANLQAKSDA